MVAADMVMAAVRTVRMDAKRMFDGGRKTEDERVEVIDLRRGGRRGGLPSEFNVRVDLVI